MVQRQERDQPDRQQQQGELHDPQRVRVDLHAGLPRSRACATDRIGDTIDYAIVRQRLHELLAQHRVKLLEALAESIAGIEFESDAPRAVDMHRVAGLGESLQSVKIESWICYLQSAQA